MAKAKEIEFMSKYEMQQQIDRLKRQIELQQHIIDKNGFCPDCWDKVNGTCFRCRVQSLEKENEKLKIHLVGIWSVVHSDIEELSLPGVYNMMINTAGHGLGFGCIPILPRVAEALEGK